MTAESWLQNGHLNDVSSFGAFFFGGGLELLRLPISFGAGIGVAPSRRRTPPTVAWQPAAARSPPRPRRPRRPARGRRATPGAAANPTALSGPPPSRVRRSTGAPAAPASDGRRGGVTARGPGPGRPLLRFNRKKRVSLEPPGAAGLPRRSRGAEPRAYSPRPPPGAGRPGGAAAGRL